MLVGDVLRVAAASLRHGSLVLLGDEEAALPPNVVGTVHVGDETRRRGDALRLLRVKTSRKFICDRGLSKRHAAASYARAASCALRNVPRPGRTSPDHISAEYQPLGRSRTVR